MDLKKQSSQRPDFAKLFEIIKELEKLLNQEESSLTIASLLNFQQVDGSFGLIEAKGLPNEARIDFIDRPTYLVAAILMREYLAGNEEATDSLKRALAFSAKTKFAGHGYEAESTLIDSLKIFIKGGLPHFLKEQTGFSPEFHLLVHNHLHRLTEYLSNRQSSGLWGEDYMQEWQKLVTALRPEKRLYLAYGSNMNQEQMKRRCSDAILIGPTFIKDWQLTMPFYANIEWKLGAKAACLVWKISARDEKNLDTYEGFPKCYRKQELLAEIGGRQITGMAYVMTTKYSSIERQPDSSYLDLIKQGYLAAGISLEQLSWL